MNILMISNIDSDEKLEDIWLARAFQEDGNNVAIDYKKYHIFHIKLKKEL